MLVRNVKRIVVTCALVLSASCSGEEPAAVQPTAPIEDPEPIVVDVVVHAADAPVEAARAAEPADGDADEASPSKKSHGRASPTGAGAEPEGGVERRPS